MKTRKPKIVMRASIPDTLRALPKGESATYLSCALGLYASAQVAVRRLNKKAGYEEFEIETADNGASYTVTRNYR